MIASVLDRLGVVGGAELVMVGDRRFDVEGAAAHGIDAIGVTWGYGSRRAAISRSVGDRRSSDVEVIAGRGCGAPSEQGT